MTNLNKQLKNLERDARKAGLLSPEFEKRVTLDKKDHWETPNENLSVATVRTVNPQDRADTTIWDSIEAIWEPYREIFDGRVIVTESGELYKTMEIPGGLAVRKIKQSIEKASGNKRAVIRLDGKSYTLRAYKLVAENFLDNPGNCKRVRFKDGNRLNTHKDNLEWFREPLNRRKFKRMGLALPDETIQEIMEHFAVGVTRKEIAQALGLKYNTVCAVILRNK